MESIQSKVVKILLRLTGYKRPMELSGDALRKNIEKTRLKENHNAPAKLKKSYRISRKEINGHYCYVMEPPAGRSSKQILYIHGGGCVYQITNLQWGYLGKLVDMLKCAITIPIYPLAPEHLCDESYEMILDLYRQMISEVQPGDLTIMGDSAGGGMSLSLAQLIKEEQLPQPGNIILISPELDATLTNPEIQALEKIDPLLAISSIKEFGCWFAGDKGSGHHMISPIYGEIEGLARISLFTGTHDLLYLDAIRFRKMAAEKGIQINFFEYPAIIHDWPLLPLPESKRVLVQIKEILK